MASASAPSRLMGLSVTTCLPASRAAIAWGACRSFGVASTTSSTSSSARTSSKRSQPRRPSAAIASRASRRLETTPFRESPGSARRTR